MLCQLLVVAGSSIACGDTTGGSIGEITIGQITIENGSIFNLNDPQEDKALFRIANRLHITTHRDVIRNQLLFNTGDSFSLQRVEESERLLRKNRYIQSASILPIQQENGVVDINVITADSWTLMPKISASRSGGENKTTIGIKEMNLFGTGMAIELFRKSDVDRDSSVIRIVDRNIGSSWYALALRFENNSDGHLRSLNLGKPFYSLNTRTAQGLSFVDSDRIEHFYDQGDDAAQYRHQTDYKEVFWGWSTGLRGGWAKRFTTGITYDEHRFSSTSLVPANRKFLYPFVGIELLQDKFEKSSNYDQINVTEDRFLGTLLSARLGLARAGSGSDRNAWLYAAAAQTGFGDSDRSSLIIAAGLNGRLEDQGVRNLSLNLTARYYRRQSKHRLFFAEISGTYGHNLDLDQFLLLGGDSGLRGYPLRYQTGDRRALLTLEQRLFSDWYPFRLFHIGGAVFFDAGRTWGDGPLSPSTETWLKDVGFGLRIGNARSGLGRMIHVDIAIPLDGQSEIKSVQFLISTRKQF